MPFTVVQATEADVRGITEIFCDDTEPNELNILQRGSAKEDDMLDKMEARHLSKMRGGEEIYIIAKDDETGQVVSYSQWLLPKEVKIMSEEEIARDKEDFLKSIPEGMNAPLVTEFRDKVLELRRNASQGKRHYELLNLGTRPNYRRKGAASALVRWSFPKADSEGVHVYLDTQETGHAREMYERLGFKHVGELSIDLKKYGGTVTHTHIAMIREPEVKS